MGVKKKIDQYTMSDEELKAAAWCVRNKICITARESGYRTSRYYIDIEKGDYPNRVLIGSTKETYKFPEQQKKLAEYKMYYYKKYADEVQERK